MSSAVVREAAMADLSGVGSLLRDTFEVYADRFGPDGRAAYLADVVDVDGRAEWADVLVAEVAGRVVASVTFLPDGTLDSHPWPPGGSVLRLLAVHPRWRGHGLGQALTRACIERAVARGSSFVGLHTAPFMSGAAALYERLGFTRAPEHDFDPAAFYGTPVGVGPDEELLGLAYVLPLATGAHA